MNYSFTEMSEEGECIFIEYRVAPGERVGIIGEMKFKGEITENKSPAIFFTEEEAASWCNWLAENKVLPSSLNHILEDELYIF